MCIHWLPNKRVCVSVYRVKFIDFTQFNTKNYQHNDNTWCAKEKGMQKG